VPRQRSTTADPASSLWIWPWCSSTEWRGIRKKNDATGTELLELAVRTETRQVFRAAVSGEQSMSTNIMDFRVREEMAGAVLKEVAALEPAERLQAAHALIQIMGQAVQGLEELWGALREPLQHGVSPSDAAILGRILKRSANLVGSSLELLVGESRALEEFRQGTLPRLQRIKAHADSLHRLVEMRAPTPGAEHFQSSLEQVARGEAVDAEAFLAEVKG
jgi:hypothetical protein